jgi:energy-coupling factor transport system permease protein
MRRPIAYQPGDSILHRLHPLSKVAWLAALSSLLFAVQHLGIVLGILVGALIAFALAGLPLGSGGLRIALVTALGLGALQVAFTREGVAVVTLGPIAMTRTGLHNGLFVAGRFVDVILLSYLFVLTTDPNDLAYGLMQAGVPYRLGFTLVTALRLVPVFEEEARTVYDAQRARGIGHDVQSPRKVLTWLRRLMMPVLNSALRKVDGLAISMEGRSFGRYPRRTFLEVRAFHRRDVVAMILLAAALTAALVLSRGTG